MLVALVILLVTVENLHVDVRRVLVALVAAVADRAASICTAFIVSTCLICPVVPTIPKIAVVRARCRRGFREWWCSFAGAMPFV